MKLQKKTSTGIVVKLLMIACVLLIGGNLFTIKAHAQGTATATTSGVIRESADTTSSKMASVKNGDKLDVIAQVTASDGYTWYKVYVDDTRKGYIRADLVSKVEGSISTESASTSNSSSDSSKTESDQSDVTTVGSKNSSTSTEDKKETAETKTESIVVNVSDSTVAAAKVKGSSVRVRETPSTSGNIKGNAKGDTEVTVSGETVDAEGNTWYQVSFNSGDSTINGFIRSDFLEVTQSVETSTEEPTEEAETEIPEEEPINDDYELNYEENDEGIQEWFLYDNLKGTKQSLNNIFEIVQQSQDSEKSDNDQLKKMKIILIIMAVVILLLVIGITVLLFKVKDSYEYDDDDEDDEEEEEEDEEEYVPVKRRKAPVKAPKKARSSRYDEDDEEEEDEEDEEDEDEDEVVKPVRRKPQQSSKKGDANWQSKNFLDVDDDMEFEFLDLK